MACMFPRASISAQFKLRAGAVAQTYYGRPLTVLSLKGVKKQNLPQKDCLVCGRPFTWRKKWEKNWEEVKYCSERCRRDRTSKGSKEMQGQ
mmetsp:Transcript_29748/g.64961  ORF Transcript_29748/g.64961 Transcript_29748/m.64961 type:complete len:91 (-) Transcript_29748:701-973(-)|eukprot:CAMPEP_0118928342 /NCGR_PEP_ID=MMETSP1169-20130426/5616_1 /TAXON_ID=36882 /ORGANISM="Pyramimonas obovata, Strain CCMP722" /LENGTH=90 /DNA_ID=CAMNT_0006870291 /DNA_START=45 /DNA_END=317 /DNA_ORIENTATION=-